MRFLSVVVFAALACTAPCNSTGDSTGDSAGDSAGDGGGCALQLGALGARVLLQCPAAGGAAAWRRRGASLGVHPAPGLALPNASLAHEGRYSCHHPSTGETWATICLRLGYPPAPPAAACWATRYPQAVNCSWAPARDTLLDTDYVATYRHGARGANGSSECVRTGPHSCSFGDIQMFSLSPYVLNVTAVNALGSASRLVPFLVEDVIKPDPPEDLQVSAIPGETKKLQLEWSPPASWPFPGYFPLKYHIRYVWDESSSPQTIGPTEQTSFTLMGLRPGALHHVQVAAKDLTDYGELSAWSEAASGTPWTGP